MPMNRMLLWSLQKISFLLFSIITISAYAAEDAPKTVDHSLLLQRQAGFFRFNFDDVKMPNKNQNMGLLGLHYFIHLTPTFYGGLGAYGAMTGTQGGLFVLGGGGGLQQGFAEHWMGDINLYVGGGGGKSSLVGGGLMLRPSMGILYEWRGTRFGLHYSYITFPNGEIRSQQIGLDLDLPADFYYLLPTHDNQTGWIDFNDVKLPNGQYLGYRRNNLGLFFQTYRQKPNTRNSGGEVQDGAMWLIGAEWDHYFADHLFWWVKTSGAFSGIPNGYMDVLGGLGGEQLLMSNGLSLIPQLGLGAGGGGMVDTAGGLLVNPLLGIEWPLTSRFSTRLSGGYIWAPQGNFKAFVMTGELLYHLNFKISLWRPYIPTA